MLVDLFRKITLHLNIAIKFTTCIFLHRYRKKKIYIYQLTQIFNQKTMFIFFVLTIYYFMFAICFFILKKCVQLIKFFYLKFLKEKNFIHLTTILKS